MADNVFSKITTFLNRMVDVISQGNFERVNILKQMNIVFKEAYFNGDLERYCKKKTSVSPLVESLTGIIPNDYDEKKDYRNYIDKKYS